MMAAARPDHIQVARRIAIGFVCVVLVLQMIGNFSAIIAARRLSAGFSSFEAESLATVTRLFMGSAALNFALSGTGILLLLTREGIARFYWVLAILAMTGYGTSLVRLALDSAIEKAPLTLPVLGWTSLLPASAALCLLGLAGALNPLVRVRAKLADSIGHRSYDAHARLEDTFE